MSREKIFADLENQAIALTGKLLNDYSEDQSFYVIGNAADFDEFSKPIIQTLKNKIFSVGLFATRQLEYPGFDGRKFYSVYHRMSGKTGHSIKTAVLCQSVIAHGSEAISIIDAASLSVDFENVVVLTTEMQISEIEYLKRYVSNEMKKNITFICGSQSQENIEIKQSTIFYECKAQRSRMAVRKPFIFECLFLNQAVGNNG